MVFGIRRRHEAEIVEFDVAETASEREILKSLGVASLTQFEKMHRLDPNMPIDELEQIDAAIREGNAEKGVEIEHLIVEDNSPYPEVGYYHCYPCSSSALEGCHMANVLGTHTVGAF